MSPHWSLFGIQKCFLGYPKLNILLHSKVTADRMGGHKIEIVGTSLKRWRTFRGKIFETGANISTRKEFIFFLDVEGFLFHLWRLSAGHVKELNYLVATKYWLPVTPLLCIIFQEVAGKVWEIFCDIILQVDSLKECLSHKTTARGIEGVGGWASCASFLSGNYFILSARRILYYLTKSN